MISQFKVDLQNVYNFYIGLFFSILIVIAGAGVIFLTIFLCKKCYMRCCKQNARFNYVEITEVQPLVNQINNISDYL